VSPGAVTNEAQGDDVFSVIDATAGGMGASGDNPYVYVRFGAAGMEKVEIDDETALESMDWDLAARRYVVRLNGGSSGPSCVGAATFEGRAYEDVVEVPAGVPYRTDDFFPADCSELITDPIGGPQVALGNWWSYGNCLAPTGNTHLIRVADGRVLKLTVTQYYRVDGCPGTDGGTLGFRWRWMTP